MREDIVYVVKVMHGSVRDIRDRALLLIEFAAAMRRSKLVRMDFEDVDHVSYWS